VSESTALLSEADKLARVADILSAQYAVELGRVLRDLERELRRLALDAVEGSRTALSRAVRAAKLRRQIRLALTAAGYAKLADTATTLRLDRLVAQVEQLRGAAQLAQFTSSDLTRILALKELATLDLLGQGDAIAHAVWRTVAQGLFSQRPVNDLLDDLSDALDVELSHARGLYDTTVSVFGRQVEAMKSRLDDVFAYVGPVDQVVRPFCRRHVGKVFTKDEIDALDNGQLPNVFLTGGGYNCRHVWQAVSKVSALRALVGTDQRMPEVEAALVLIPVGGRKAA
jgi:hypothetical protein